MDRQVRLAENQFATSPTFESAMRLSMAYERAGLADIDMAADVRDVLVEHISILEVPSVVLYTATEHDFESQAPLDFRSLLHRPPVPADISQYITFAYNNFPRIQFNGGIDFSIQAGPAHYSNPRQLLDNIYGYTRWEALIMDRDGFFSPYMRRDIYGWDDKEDEDYEELQQIIREAKTDPLAKIDFHYSTITRTDPKTAPGGYFYGMPMLDRFSVPDDGILPYVAVSVIQSIFDFLRARFGLVG